MNVWLSEILRTWRASLRRPGFLLLAVTVLGLGVGAVSAVFTMIDGVLLRPLPYAEPHRLVAMGPLWHGDVGGASPQQYQQLVDLPGVGSHGIFKVEPAVNIAGGGGPVQVPALQMDRGLLPTLRVQLALGRNFSAVEDQPHGPPAVILFHGFWQRRFGGNPAVVGRTLVVEGAAHTIVGVLPAGFDLGQAAIALPTAFPADSRDDGTNYTAVARLARDATAETLATQVDTRLHAFYVGRDGDFGKYWRKAHFGTQDFGAEEHAGQRAMSLMWLACAALLLLIALVNLTNLMLLRAMGRSHDAAIRGALGASPWRMALPSIAEGVLIGLGGLLLGQILAALGLLALRTWMPTDWMAVEWTRPGGLSLGLATWGLAAGIAVFGALVAVLLGLWRGRVALSMDSLREGGRSGLSRRGGWFGRMLVIAQVALASLLLCTAGIFLHTLLDNARKDLGFDAHGVLTFELAPLKATYADAASVQMLSQRLVERLRHVPGVLDAAVGTNLPAGDWRGQWNMGMHLPGGDNFSAQFHAVDPAFFQVFGIHLRQGRGFAATDRRGGAAVAIVNQKFAHLHFGDHALGQTIEQGAGPEMLSARIVGVVNDTYQLGPEAPDSVMPILYLPLAQMPDDDLRAFRDYEPLRFALKVRGKPESYREAVKHAVAEVAPEQPINRVVSMAYVVHDITTDTEFNLMLIGLFGGLSLLLAGVGMYAVMAVAVAARECEFGVRAALGAAPRGLLLLVLRAGLVQICLGLLAGFLLGFLGSGALRAVVVQLGQSVLDPWSITASCAVLAAAGVLACLLPALRAARAEPMRALRGE